ncbi:Pfemp3-like protein [Reticulomyxa filosa]|uniref:Pfemp3-like protein n=1 Tax=Reticulomyxa filosa TaxID=46433 RepID=X6MP52_RETFI|nr:Pfemp3-like protein [Reticulomyxa filosa]|eukprot:ETO15644.1 Pfemp3-like protein [Reticulomyxa filosa]
MELSTQSVEESTQHRDVHVQKDVRGIHEWKTNRLHKTITIKEGEDREEMEEHTDSKETESVRTEYLDKHGNVQKTITHELQFTNIFFLRPQYLYVVSKKKKKKKLKINKINNSKDDDKNDDKNTKDKDKNSKNNNGHKSDNKHADHKPNTGASPIAKSYENSNSNNDNNNNKSAKGAKENTTWSKLQRIHNDLTFDEECRQESVAADRQTEITDGNDTLQGNAKRAKSYVVKEEMEESSASNVENT